jgi:probable rRNA maturation factor
MSELVLCNRQRVRRVNTRLLRQIITHTLNVECDVAEYELGVHLVGAKEMARMNWNYLRHEGSTDVITFDHAERAATGSPLALHGEIYVCVDDAVRQANQFHTTWQLEVVRYVVHGILHLLGHDDCKPAARRRMKLEENRLVRRLARAFPLTRLATC